MTAKERILAIKLMEKLERDPEYAVQLGIQAGMVKRNSQDEERRKTMRGQRRYAVNCRGG